MKGLRILNLNIQSLFYKLDEINVMILESDPDIIGITETWLHDGIDDSELQIPNYTMYRNDRADGYGGVAFYIHIRLETNLIHLSQPEPSKVETLWLKLTLPNTRPVIIGIVYGPKVCAEYFENLDLVLSEINELSVTFRTPAEILCLGDFNCDMLKPNEWEWKKLQSIMYAHQMTQIITSATRITQLSKTCIDHVWTNRPEMYINHGVITFPFSDHSLVFAVRKSQRAVKGPSRNIKARSYRSFDADAFLNDLKQIPWGTVEVSDNPDIA